MSTILIIDDDEQFNLMMKKALEIKGYNVETAKNGREAKALYQNKTYDVIITDEAQFFTPAQIDQLRALVDEEDIPVLCFGLRTDFLTHFFPGSQRLMELADSLTEIKTVCACGRKATVNARIDGEGRIVTEGAQVMLGGNDSYVAMCHKCWKKKIREQRG